MNEREWDERHAHAMEECEAARVRCDTPALDTAWMGRASSDTPALRRNARLPERGDKPQILNPEARSPSIKPRGARQKADCVFLHGCDVLLVLSLLCRIVAEYKARMSTASITDSPFKYAPLSRMLTLSKASMYVV